MNRHDDDDDDRIGVPVPGSPHPTPTATPPKKEPEELGPTGRDDDTGIGRPDQVPPELSHLSREDLEELRRLEDAELDQEVAEVEEAPRRGRS